MEQCWNDTDEDKTEVLEENPVIVIVFSLQISDGLRWN